MRAVVLGVCVVLLLGGVVWAVAANEAGPSEAEPTAPTAPKASANDTMPTPTPIPTPTPQQRAHDPHIPVPVPIIGTPLPTNTPTPSVHCSPLDGGRGVVVHRNCPPGHTQVDPRKYHGYCLKEGHHFSVRGAEGCPEDHDYHRMY